MPTVSTVRRPLAVRASVRLIGAQTIVKFFQKIIQIRRHCLGHLQFRPKFRADYCSHRIEQRTVFRQQRRGYASRVAMGCPHLFDSPISYPAPHKTEFLGRLPSFCAAGASRGYTSLLVKEAPAFLVPKIAASEHCSHCSAPARTRAGGCFIRLLMGRRALTPHYPIGTPGPRLVIVMSKERPCDRRHRASLWRRNIDFH